MNHQELSQLVKPEIRTIDTSILSFSKMKKCDLNTPNFFAGWPYFIIVLAALLMGFMKVSQQESFSTQLHPQNNLQTLVLSKSYEPRHFWEATRSDSKWQ